MSDSTRRNIQHLQSLKRFRDRIRSEKTLYESLLTSHYIMVTELRNAKNGDAENSAGRPGGQYVENSAGRPGGQCERIIIRAL